MGFAIGIDVPFEADSVASPEVRYKVGEDEFGQSSTCLIIYCDEGLVRVTFEGFDAIRCCRGEHLPYDDDDSTCDDPRFPWVFEVQDSAWIAERHKYEFKHYQCSLLEEYVHYLFSFHDEYVELIAKGIWFEKVTEEQLGKPQPGHPLDSLPTSLPAERFEVEGIECFVRRNPLPVEQLLKQSKLCSQVVFQYFMTLEGRTSPSYPALLRTVRNTPITRLRNGLFYKDLFETSGIGEEPAFRRHFSQYVSEVAERRRQMGKSP